MILIKLIKLIKLILSFILKWKFSKIKLKLQKIKIPQSFILLLNKLFFLQKFTYFYKNYII